ncbi:ABC transporter ATP-binding protein [Thalassotalea agarivorans]|uniref:ABC-2 type transport system ATP-binding protein n=1 Tax=Thalassotalea agarivorans TaxID=349064 RepID=A0A1H9YN33_THASX|nr:ABC transporter ATP-binding protein [Thalassotalea agarivorans]SES70461.1 ABC-2 type transport system ATP-binding protein [Thalassotalea agarivorans]
MNDIVISANQLTRKFGDFTAIDRLDLAIEKGTIYGFLGPNGCGKTTTIRMLTGLLKPSSGDINVLNHQLPKGAENLRLNIGYMTQKFSLYNDLTVKENLQFLATTYGFSKKQSNARIDELTQLYDLTDILSQITGSMSGGQRQRLALAGAVLHDPSILFLDEPTSAVDPETRRDFWEKLFDLSAQGTSILVSTHYMDEAERCHKLAILEGGVKRADGSPKQLMQDMDAHVIELSSKDIREVKRQVLTLKDVKSAAQLGSFLRVLVTKAQTDPIAYLKQALANSSLTIDEISEVRPSLEDVFVMCTGKEAKHD